MSDLTDRARHLLDERPDGWLCGSKVRPLVTDLASALERVEKLAEDLTERSRIDESDDDYEIIRDVEITIAELIQDALEGK